MTEIRVLYIAYWGAAEPLGRSLVVPSILCLARKGVRLSLVTFEKPQHLRDASGMSALRAPFAEAGVEWTALRYHKRPRVPATSFDIACGFAQAIREGIGGRLDLVHARTFVGGMMGLLASRALGVPLVYHNEGFYPDEQVDGGVWRAGSFPHRLARAIESRLYASAAGIITLSHRARAEVEAMPRVAVRGTPVAVVPSTVDLGRFVPSGRAAATGPLRLVYIGSIGLRYIFDRAARFAAVAGRRRGVALSVLTPAQPDEVRRSARAAGLPEAALEVAFVAHEDMPGRLAGHHAGLFFLARGLSEHGCSPTKVGEYWACGLPVVTTANVSDTDAIVRRERVGVMIEDHTEAAYERAAAELEELLADPELPARCRRAAEAHYSLEAGCEAQRSLYDRVIRGRSE